MAKKVAYRAVAIEKVTSAMLAALLAGAARLVVAVDVAKTKMMAGFGREDGGIVRLVRFNSPMQTRVRRARHGAGKHLGVPVEALMEPTGTYGEGLRGLLEGGVSVFMTTSSFAPSARFGSRTWSDRTASVAATWRTGTHIVWLRAAAGGGAGGARLGGFATPNPP